MLLTNITGRWEKLALPGTVPVENQAGLALVVKYYW